jgi:hypothetical protein
VQPEEAARMTRWSWVFAAAAVLLISACGSPGAATPEVDATLGNWFADGVALADTAPDAAGTDAAVADAIAVTPDVALDVADGATTDVQLADVVTADVVIADVADSAAVSDVPDVVDVPDVDAGPPGVCFKGAPPSGDAFVADILPDNPSACPTNALPPTWFTGDVPAATLIVTPGSLDSTGAFSAYLNDAWVPIIYGPQGSFHIWAGFTISPLAVTTPTLAVDVQVWADENCVTKASGVASKVTTVQVADGVYSNVFTGSSGIPTQFYVPAASSYLYCGHWVNLHIRVHDPASGTWGETVRSLRIYDSKP